jgi:hypothetical protein
VNRIFFFSACALLVASCSHDSPPQTTPVIPASCNLPVPQPAALDGGVIELGTHAVGDDIAFTVPAGTASVSIVQQAVGKVPLQVVLTQNGGQVVDNSAVPRFIHFPDGGLAYDDFQGGTKNADGTITLADKYVEYSQDSPVAATMTFPNTATSLAQGVAPGAWSFRVGDFSYECATGLGCSDGGTTADQYDVKVILRPAAPAAPRLDVNFYIVSSATTASGQPFTAAVANAGTDPSVKRLVQTFTAIYSQVGITLGNVRFFDVSAADRATYSVITVGANSTGQGPCDQIDQLFTLSGANPSNAMNLFLVDAIDDSSGQQTIGIDSTIPGMASFAGTVHSGAIVSSANLFAGTGCTGALTMRCGADQVAYISAHETGHFLGLFHTTEGKGDLIDPLNTAKCACTVCEDATQRPNCGTANAGLLNPAFCRSSTNTSCQGGDNLMFYAIDFASTGTLTSTQGAVMKLNPLVQ